MVHSQPPADGTQPADAGYVVPHWPRPWGLDASPILQLVIDDEMRRAKVSRRRTRSGSGGPARRSSTPAATSRRSATCFPLLAGEEVWCQLFSEPGAGSDLAVAHDAGRCATATSSSSTARRSGRRVRRSSKFGILIARTDPDVPKHRGISYFICPMDTPGIEVRPIKEMTGTALFNEVFFTDVRLPAANLVGDLNGGWALAKVTLANERVSLSGGGALWGSGPSASDLLDQVRAEGGVRRPADAATSRRAAHRGGGASTDPAAHGDRRDPRASARTGGIGAQGARRRARPAHHGAREGPRGHLPACSPATAWPVDAMWHHGYLFARALTIGGGTAEVQRNIIAERVLGLPHDPAAA